MEKEKIQQIVLIVLIPVFLLGLVLTRLMSKKDAGSTQQEPAIDLKVDESIKNIPKPDPAPKFKYESGKTDPLKNYYASYMEKLENEKPQDITTVDIPLPELNIEGLIWNSETPQAIINGEVVMAGDVIEGLTVIKIERGGITIDHEGELVFLPKATINKSKE